MGQTASGKTVLAEAVASLTGAQLVNSDAFQVYRGLDIGTAKPLRHDLYELLDLCDPSESFGLGEWIRLADVLLKRLFLEGRSVVLVGGTGLYVRALLEGYADMAQAPHPEVRAEFELREAKEGLGALADELSQIAPQVALRTDLKNPVRVRRALERLRCSQRIDRRPLPNFRVHKFAVEVSPNEIDDRIGDRVRFMMQNGWIQEVERLREKGYSRDDPGLRAIGYRRIWDHLDDNCSLDEAMEKATLETRQYAKRQRTWLRKEPRLTWLEPASRAESPSEWATRLANELV